MQQMKKSASEHQFSHIQIHEYYVRLDSFQAQLYTSLETVEKQSAEFTKQVVCWYIQSLKRSVNTHYELLRDNYGLINDIRILRVRKDELEMQQDAFRSAHREIEELKARLAELME